jgi:hypothetical protein
MFLPGETSHDRCVSPFALNSVGRQIHGEPGRGGAGIDLLKTFLHCPRGV